MLLIAPQGPTRGAERGRPTGLIVNEDNSHFMLYRPAEKMTLEGLREFIDQYAGTQVSHLFFCPNTMRMNVYSFGEKGDHFSHSTFRLHTGPRPTTGQVVPRAVLAGTSDVRDAGLLVDGAAVIGLACFVGLARRRGPGPAEPSGRGDRHVAGRPAYDA